MSKQSKDPTPISSSDLSAWLRGKLKDAERAVKFREDSEAIWRDGSDKSWRAEINESERLEWASTHAQIAVKCRREVAMFKAVIERLTT